jgi:sugar-specific transcriptional regulator TrmB
MTMNKERRKSLDGAILELNKVKDELEKISWSQVNDWLTSAKTAIEEAKDEEQEAYDNMTEGLQATERGQRMDEVINNLDNVMSNIDDIIQKVDDNDSFVVAVEDVIGEIEECLD